MSAQIKKRDRRSEREGELGMPWLKALTGPELDLTLTPR